MKGLYGCIVIIFISFVVTAQTNGDYRSRQTGNWNSVTTWQVFNSAAWHNLEDVGAGAFQNITPTSASGIITIMDLMTVTVTADVTVDQIEYENNPFTGNTGTLSISSGATLTVNNGLGDDIRLLNDFTSVATLEVNGTLFLSTGATMVDDDYGNLGSGPVPVTPDTYKVKNGGVHVHTTGSGVDRVPFADWQPGSTCQINATVAGVPFMDSTIPFHHFIWNGSGQSATLNLAGTLRTVNGDFTVTSTNGVVFQLSTTTGYTLNIGGNFSIQGNSRVQFTSSGNPVVHNITGNLSISSSSPLINAIQFNATGNVDVNITGDFSKSDASTLNLCAGSTGTTTLDLTGNFSLTGGTFTRGSTVSSGGATVSFLGSNTKTFTNSSTISNAVNFSIANGKILNLATSAMTGTGTFLLNAGGTLGIGSPDGLNISSTNLGNIRVLGTRTYTTNGNIIYNGTVGQNLGDEWSSTGGLNGIAVNLEIANINLAGVTNNIIGSTSLVGNLTLTSNPLHIGNSNTLIIQSNFTATSGTIGGLSTSNLTFSGSGTITGSLNFASGAQNLNNFTISRSGTIPLGTPLTISGTLAFSSTGNLQFNGQTLTVNGNITQSGSGGLVSNSTSNLIIGGTGALSALPFVSSSQLNNLILGRTTGGTYTLSSAVTINGILDLNSGTLTHSSGLTMASGSTFSRSSGASITTNAPNTSASYNVSYTGTLTTGLELPSSATALNNLTVAGDATLDKAVTINGDLNINSGTFNASAFNLAMAGANFLVNGGAFTINPANTVTFSRTGTTTMGGSTIGGTQFGNITISSLATLAAPNANINVSATWDNLGSFTPNSGTVTFNGTTQTLDPNGQPFNNVVFANSGIKTLAGILDVNGSLTINTGVSLDAGSSLNTINIAGTWANSGTFTASGNTVIFDGTSSQTITESGSFFNLQLSGSGTKTLGAVLDVDNDLVINTGVTFTTSASSYAITLGGDWTNDGSFTAGATGTVTFNGTSVIGGLSITSYRNITLAGLSVTAPSGMMDIAGNWLYSSGTFTANGGTIQFNGSGNQSITPGGQSFFSVVIAGSNTKTLQGNTDVNGNLTLTSGTLSVGLNRTVNLAGNFETSAGIFAAQSGLFIFDGAAQNITSAGETFFNTEFSGTGTKTLVDAFDVNGNVDINSTLAAGVNTITIAGNWDDTGTFTSTGSTIFDGGTQNILSTGSSFGSLTIAGTGQKTLQDALSVNSDLTVTSTLDDAGNFLVVVGGNWDTSVGTFNPGVGEVRLDGIAQNITSGASNFYNLSLAGTGIKTLQDPLDVNGNLLIQSSSGLNVGTDNTIEVAGNWTNNSGLGASSFVAGNGLVIFDGGATSNVTGTGTTTFRSINVTGATNVEIESTHNLTGTLTLVGASSRFDAQGSGNNGVFTLISSDDSPTMDGRIASLTTPGNFTGNVTVQRFMSQESMPTLTNNRLYRYISSPVSGAPVSQIQSEIPVTGSFTGSSSCSGCTTSQSMFGYNETIGTTFDDGWVDFPVNANTEALQQGTGYALYVRGNIISSALWDLRGPIFSGNINLPVTYNNVGTPGADGFNLVGNPYPSAIDWDMIHPSATNIANAVYIRDNPNGRYTQYVGGIGSNGGTKDIAMGQAFWVEATAPSPLLPLTESMKSSSATNFFRTAPFSDLLRITLAQPGLSDEIVIHFNNDATDLFDAAFDARKLQNTIFNLSSVLTDNNKLSINTLGSISCGRDIKLEVSDVTTGYYELTLAGVESFSNQVSIKLIDTYLNQTLDARTTSIYGFNVDSNIPATFGGNRFRMIFEFDGSITPPEFMSSDVCQGSDATLNISNSQLDIHYAIYTNGILVQDIGAGTGSNLSVTLPKDQLVEGDNIFKLKAVNSYCNEITVEQEFVIKNEVLPQITSTKGASNCLSGALSLTASGAEEGDYRWYESLDDLTPLATSSIYTTPEISKTKTYYVSAVNSLGCEGTRSEVIAEIIHYDPVILTESGNGQLVSSYSEGNQWYKDGELMRGLTSQIITPTESGTYTVEVKLGQCITSAQQMFLVTGNDEAFSNGKLNVYPNPVKQELVVESKAEQKQPPVIFDPTGKIIGTLYMARSQNGWVGRFDFSGKTKGLYILQIMENGVPKFKRIIKE